MRTTAMESVSKRQAEKYHNVLLQWKCAEWSGEKASKDAGTTGTGTTVLVCMIRRGKPFMLRLNGKTDYFYLYNGLGDITGLVDSSNQVVVRYQYNSWGKVTSSEDTSGVSLAT